MTAFLIVCAAMVLLAVVWVAWPIVRPASIDGAGTRIERRLLITAVALALPLAAGVLYAKLSTWKWNDPQVEQAMQMSAQLGELQKAVREKPHDLDGWVQLGRSYVQLGQFSNAVTAFESAYRLTGGQDADITASLGEALAMSDETSLDGRAGQLFEEALARSPSQPKALFYSSIGAMRAGKLELARDRLKGLLAQSPPEQIRPMLEREIQDLEEQIKNGGGVAQEPPAATTGGRVVKVAVSLAPALQQQLREPLTLFILARDPAAGGPPLAVERRSSSELPLTVELTEADAMLPSHTIGSVGEAQIVARISRSGTPQQQSGDIYGEARLQFDANKPAQAYDVAIVIDRRVP